MENDLLQRVIETERDISKSVASEKEKAVAWLAAVEQSCIDRVAEERQRSAQLFHQALQRFALTVAEYLAYELGMDVLVIITDITNYCDALREISNAREELPGRRGYPGYMYSDLASLFERAGRVMGMDGSVTIIPALNMPEDDITHPIPDLTGYITEGQIVLQRQLHRRRLFPPIDVLPSLSRLMQKGIGKGQTREDHRRLANLLYKHYAKGRELKKLEAIIGRDGMSDADTVLLDFADCFENEFINQGMTFRNITASLDCGWELLERFKLANRNTNDNN